MTVLDAGPLVADGRPPAWDIAEGRAKTPYFDICMYLLDSYSRRSGAAARTPRGPLWRLPPANPQASRERRSCRAQATSNRWQEQERERKR